jgi:hypothetical protein
MKLPTFSFMDNAIRLSASPLVFFCSTRLGIYGFFGAGGLSKSTYPQPGSSQAVPNQIFAACNTAADGDADQLA